MADTTTIETLPILDENEENEEIELDNDTTVESESKIFPIKRDDLQVQVTNWNIFAIIEYIKKGKIELQPLFQRSYIWTDKQAEKLIDSIRNGFPIPQVFLLQKEDGTSLVIDGQQRLTSIIRFILNESEIEKNLPNIKFKDYESVDNLKLLISAGIFYNQKELEQKGYTADQKIKFEDLEQEIQNKIEAESLIVAHIKPVYSSLKKDDVDKISKEIFYRLNTGGTKLTSQEIRLSLFHGNFMREIRNFSFTEGWNNLLPTNVKKFKDEISLVSELLVRAFAFFDVFSDIEEFDSIGKVYKKDNSSERLSYIKPFKDFFDTYAQASESFDQVYVDQRKILLEQAVSLLSQIESYKDKSLFKHNKNSGENKRSKVFNIKYIDIIFVGVLNILRYKKDLQAQELYDAIEEFKNNETLIEEHVSKEGGADERYVQERVKAGIDFFKQKFSTHD